MLTQTNRLGLRAEAMDEVVKLGAGRPHPNSARRWRASWQTYFACRPQYWPSGRCPTCTVPCCRTGALPEADPVHARCACSTRHRRHGWQSTHTVIESSTTTCRPGRHGDDGGNRHGSQLHLIIIRWWPVNRDADGVLQVLSGRRSGTADSFIHVPRSTACPNRVPARRAGGDLTRVPATCVRR